jgi:heptosyltransferase-3
MGKKIERVLIYRLGSLGDTVAALPALHLVERTFPGAERRMLTNFPINHKAAAATAILGESGIVQGYFEYPVGSRKPIVLLKLWWKLFSWRPQVMVYLAAARGIETAKRDSAFFKACGMPRQVGVPLTEDMQKNRWQPEHNALEPECERLARNLAELGDAEIDRRESWDLRLTEAEKAKAREVLAPASGRPLIVFSVGTKLQANDWGRDNWRALMVRLGVMYSGHALAFTGVQAESEMSEFVADGWREGAGPGGLVLNFCGELTPRESAACFAQAKVFIGHDSGPMHLASSVGTRVVAIFSARNLPRIWFPHGAQHRVMYHEVNCMGCGLETCVVERKKCIVSITVEEVLEAVRGVLEGDRIAGVRAPLIGGDFSRG